MQAIHSFIQLYTSRRVSKPFPARAVFFLRVQINKEIVMTSKAAFASGVIDMLKEDHQKVKELFE